MSYLDIIATCTIILFPHQTGKKYPRSLSSGSLTPTTPTFSLPPPSPISVSLNSIMYGESECAYFLLTHVLAQYAAFPDSGLIGRVTKEAASEAEILVWQELDKAKTFIRSLGTWFMHRDHIDEAELEDLAVKSGLGLRWEEVQNTREEWAESEKVAADGTKESGNETFIPEQTVILS